MDFKVGDRLLCIKDVFMSSSGDHEYTKGKVYLCETSCCITNNSGNIYHSWSSDCKTETFFRKQTTNDLLGGVPYIPPNIEPFKCEAYYSQGPIFIGMLNHYEFNNLRIHIMKNNLEGYYMKYNGHIINILPNGRTDKYVDGFYDMFENQLDELLGL